mgnify:CR=1 FL=1
MSKKLLTILCYFIKLVKTSWTYGVNHYFDFRHHSKKRKTKRKAKCVCFTASADIKVSHLSLVKDRKFDLVREAAKKVPLH